MERQVASMSTTWDEPGPEPSLDDVLSDPIVRLLMQGDGTEECEVRKLLERVRASLAVAGPSLAGPAQGGGRQRARRKVTRAA